jgi:hypothetical protein
MEGVRNANIGIAVAVAFLVPSVLLFKDAGQGVVQAIGLIGFFLGMAVMAFLDGRDWRRQQRDQ